jgi:DNA polymerase-2
VFSAQRAVLFLAAADAAAGAALLAAERGVESRQLPLKTFAMEPVVAVYCRGQRQLRRLADALRQVGCDPLESDVNPADRFLMERFIQGSARLSGVPRRRGGHWYLQDPRIAPADYTPAPAVVSFDIETALEGLQLYSIAVHAVRDGAVTRRVFMLGPGETREPVHYYPDQQGVLDAFLAWLDHYDPDVLIGWNVVNFDTWYLQRLADRFGRKLALGRDHRPVHWRELDEEGERRTVQAPGRVILDGIELLRTAFYRFESFSLEYVSRQLLGEGKRLAGADRGQAITDLFREDKAALAEYNLRDCELVWDIFRQTALLEFAVARSRMTGLNIDRAGGSVASFDYLYLPRLHRAGYVAPNPSHGQEASPGGFVLESAPGIYDHVLVLDFKSLYPSIIRTFFIDPLGLALGTSGELTDAETVPGFLAARFARHGHILPQLIEQLWAQRDAAKSAADAPLSQAIKIIMNSFYGVLGSPGCRFFDARLASSITRRGHQILQRTREQIEAAGQTVIYGDTDSVFVWVREARDDAQAQAIGRQLQEALNRYWRDTLAAEFALDSVLELEFETHYKRFLMPTVRGSDKGSKKRYAGVVADGAGDRLVFKGLENVRTDWTALAREFQEELYRRVFMQAPFEAWVRSTVNQVRAGALDDKLVYRKRLRRRLDDYQRNVPPHVQAARLARERGMPIPGRGEWVEYVITLQGPEPAVDARAALDYDHYVERQLEPVADAILGFLGLSFRALADRQLAMF